MGECFVTLSVESPVPVNFSIGDYIEYRGERFYLNYDPTATKTSSKESIGNAFRYNNIKFNNAADELTRCDFLDIVIGDNNIHYTSLPKFSFFAARVNDLADRIQANLDRIYAGSRKWTVTVDAQFEGNTDVNVEVNNINVWGALGLCTSLFKANFIIRGRTIKIGTSGIIAEGVFKYGKGNGLKQIERTADQDQQIITRLRAYGSTRNLPARYYHEKSEGMIPNNLAADHLMLPGFPEETLDPYIDSDNIEELGIREATVIFDGTGDLEEIYPTMEGMKDESGNPLDEIFDAEQITDDGTPDEEGGIEKGQFTLEIRNPGFDLNDNLSEGQAAKITMQSGMCGSREFEIVSCEKNTDGYTLTCNRQLDEALQLYFPYKDYNIKKGDKFTFSGIDLPDVYIRQASERLKTAAQKYLAENDYVRYTYSPAVDNIYMARQHDNAMASGGMSVSLHDTIKEGDIMLFEDADLGIDASIIIDKLTIKEGGQIPEYTITLRNEKTVGTIQRLQQQIDSIANGQGGGGYNASQIRELIKSYGKDLFLSKVFPDIASGLITLLKGATFGKYLASQSGGKIDASGIAELLGIILRGDLKSINFSTGALGAGYFLGVDDNGDSYLEVDRMLVRKVAYFVELVIQRMSHVGGQIVLTPASMKCSKVEEHDTFYRCYFENTDGDKTITNDFVAGDQARCQTFNVKPGTSQNVSNTYYWRLVVAVGDDYIDLSKTDCDAGSTTPQADDEIVLLGNRTDATRQSAIVLASYGNDAPYFKLYRGINSYQLDGKEFLSFSHSQIKIIADELLFSTGESVSTVINGVKEEVMTVKTEISGVKTDLTNTKTDLQGQIDGIQINTRNLASKTNIKNNAGAAVNGYEYTFTAQSTDGLFIPKSVFGLNEEYVLSFKLKVNSGDLKNIGGHQKGFSVKNITINGVSQGQTWDNGCVSGIAEENLVIAHVKKTDDGGNNIGLYIQPNRLASTKVNVTISEVSVVKGTRYVGWTPAPEDVQQQITDAVDGYIARKRNIVTNLGKFIDPLADKILVIAVLTALVELHRFPAWMVVVIISREFIVSGLRMVAASEGVVIAASKGGKLKTVTQIIGIILLLFNIPGAMAVMWLAVILTVWSGIEYIRNSMDLLS